MNFAFIIAIKHISNLSYFMAPKFIYYSGLLFIRCVYKTVDF